MLDQMDLIDLYKTSQATAAEYVSPPQHTEHSPRYIKQPATKQTKHYALKLQVCNKKNFGNYTNTCQLGNLFVIKERLKNDIETFFETNKNGDTTCQKF